ncbi:MAG TPA: 4Fe-4S dicluster domain-containing protein [Cellulomonas sp.]
MKIGTVVERLAANRYETDEQESHIVVDQEAARRTGCAARLVAVCPAGVYAQEADGTLSVEYAACFECGACAAVATDGVLSWRYPRGGTGIQLREG